MQNYLFSFIFFLTSVGAFAQSVFPYKNPSLSIEERVADLLKRMTPEEKFRQLFMIAHDGVFDSTKYNTGIFGLEINTTSLGSNGNQQMMENKLVTRDVLIKEMNRIQHFLVNNTRLGIPAIFFGEALHGVVGTNDIVFPQSIALAASFDTALMRRVATAIAKDAYKSGYRQVLSPVINIASDVRWGRVEETYGEDPYLTSEMAVAFVKAFEQKNVITTPKHFAVNVGEGGRDSYPIHLDEDYMKNIFLEPFKQAIQRGGARSIMTSYNSLNGKPCSMNDDLLKRILKKEWGFTGFVISDAGAVGGANVLHNTSASYPMSGKVAIENGLDVIFQTSITHDTLFNPYFLKGAVNPVAIDAAVARVLKAKFELGLFDDPYVLLDQEQERREEQLLALEASLKSAVLLRNKNKVLPLRNDIKRVCVVGQDAIESRLGGYSGAGFEKITYLEGLKNRFSAASISFHKGVARMPVEFKVIESACANCQSICQLSACYFNTTDLSGEPIKKQMEKSINFHYTFSAPAWIQKEHFSVRYEGMVLIPEDGEYKIGVEGNDGYRFYIANTLIADRWEKLTYHRDYKVLQLKKGDLVLIKIEYRETVGNAQLKLIWDYQCDKNESNTIIESIHVASKSDVIVYCPGIEEGEFRDRSSLSLPGRQEELIKRLSRLNKPLIVVLTGGSAIRMDRWIDSVDAVIDMWYPGEQGGNALAQILAGDVSPSGKLPITFPLNEGQLPLSYLHEATGRGDDYIDGTGLPLFPFGYGLSYAKYEYSDLVVQELDSFINVQFTIANSGQKGAATPQVYLSLLDEPSGNGIVHPVLQLVAFSKVELAAFAKTKVEMRVSKATCFKSLNPDSKVHYRINVGESCRDLPLTQERYSE